MNLAELEAFNRALELAERHQIAAAHEIITRLRRSHPYNTRLLLCYAYTTSRPEEAREALALATLTAPGHPAVKAAQEWLDRQLAKYKAAPPPATSETGPAAQKPGPAGTATLIPPAPVVSQPPRPLAAVPPAQPFRPAPLSATPAPAGKSLWRVSKISPARPDNPLLADGDILNTYPAGSVLAARPEQATDQPSAWQAAGAPPVKAASQAEAASEPPRLEAGAPAAARPAPPPAPANPPARRRWSRRPPNPLLSDGDIWNTPPVVAPGSPAAAALMAGQVAFPALPALRGRPVALLWLARLWFGLLFFLTALVVYNIIAALFLHPAFSDAEKNYVREIQSINRLVSGTNFSLQLVQLRQAGQPELADSLKKELQHFSEANQRLKTLHSPSARFDKLDSQLGAAYGLFSEGAEALINGINNKDPGLVARGNTLLENGNEILKQAREELKSLGLA